MNVALFKYLPKARPFMKAYFNAISILLATACILVTPQTSFASEKPENVTEAEKSMLPAYCPYTMGEKGHKQPYIDKWKEVMGEGFFHMHHYCWALVDLQRAERTGVPETEKRFLRNRALGGFKYVIRNAPDDFILLPEIYTRAGSAEILLDHPENAGKAFAMARKLKPDYWPPYYHWAEFLQSHGKREEAMEVVKTGLQHSPTAKPLLLLFSHLGGNPKDIPAPASLPDNDTPVNASGNTP